MARRIANGHSPIHLALRDRLIGIGIISLVIDLLATTAIFFLERNQNNTEIHTYFDAFFWVSAQLLTVSSQFPNPLSVGGRIIDLGLELYSITAVTTVAGSFAAFFLGIHLDNLDRQKADGQ